MESCDFGTVVDQGRLSIISFLLDADESTSVDNLVEEMVTSRKDRKSVRTHLYHLHLPKLETAGLVDYDWDEGEIVLAEDKEVLTAFLNSLEDDDSAPLKFA